MTREQRDRVIALRKTGMGYKSIANEIGLTKEAVSYICKSRGLGGYGADIHPENTCPECGEPLIQTMYKGRKKKFCSELCRRNWWKRHPQQAKRSEMALYIIKCRHCGKQFAAYGNRHRVYCSRDCYIQDRFWT